MDWNRRTNIELRAFDLATRYPSLAGTENWTGERFGVGTGSIYNTQLTKTQFFISLALSNHPLMLEVSKLPIDTDGREIMPTQQLIDAQVLAGIKIIDLGCGHVPAFARLTRWLGADTYTADIISADTFEYDKFPDQNWPARSTSSKRDFPDWLRNQDFEKHIVCDLRKKESLDLLLERTKGEFDMVTEAHVNSGANYEGKLIYAGDIEPVAEKLLKCDGIFYSANRYFDFKVKRIVDSSPFPVLS